MSGLRRPLLTARVIRGLKKMLPELQHDHPDADCAKAVQYLTELVRFTETEEYQQTRDRKNTTVRNAKAKRKKDQLP